MVEHITLSCAEQNAIALAQRGLHVHPLVPRDKAPLLEGYPSLATTDEATIHQWWKEWPDANVGLIAGVQSGAFVLDIDRRHGGEQSLRILEAQHPELPMTWQDTTHDGFHIYLRHPSDCIIKSGDLAPGIQVLSNGHNVVGPGSIHPSGHGYEWMEFYHPDTLPLADPPSWLIDLLQAKNLFSCVAKTAPTPQASKIPEISPPARVPLLALDAGTLEETSLSGPLDGEEVKALFGQWRVVERCLHVLGLPHVRPGKKFRCILHEERHPSAAICPPQTPGQPFLYMDFHHGEGEPQALILPLVYYCRVTGAPTSTRLPEPTLLVWSLRLLKEAGVIAGVPIHAPKLKGAPEHAQRVYDGFLELLSLKWLVTDRAPSPFSWRFAKDWLPGLTMTAVSSGIQWLMAKGYLRVTDMMNKMALFLFGSRALIHRRTRRALESAQEDIVVSVAQDMEAMLEPASDPCPDCGRAGWFNAARICQWCVALAGQARLLERRRLSRVTAVSSG